MLNKPSVTYSARLPVVQSSPSMRRRTSYGNTQRTSQQHASQILESSTTGSTHSTTHLGKFEPAVLCVSSLHTLIVLEKVFTEPSEPHRITFFEYAAQPTTVSGTHEPDVVTSQYSVK